MKVTVLYFAQLADLAGKTEEAIDLSTSAPSELYDTLKQRYAFPHTFEQLQVAVNHSLSAHETALKDGDTIAFLPPMTGG